jgi:hypothetical protein
MEEAQFSFNLKFQVSGMEAQFTCRAGEEQSLGSFRNTILAACQMVQSLGGSPRASSPGGPGNGHKKTESIKPEQKVCTVCNKADALRLIEFTPKGSTKSMFKYKCERCNKWLSYTPSDEEIAAFRQQSEKELLALWA